MQIKHRRHALLLLLVLGSAIAQQVHIYPTKGQSKQQLEKDKFACYGWAKGQSGFDPMNPPSQQQLEAKARQHQAPQQQQQQSSGGNVVRGAVRGAVAGEIVGGDAGKGAALGAIAGGIRGERRARKKQQQQAQAQQQAVQQQAQAKLQKLRDSYNRAYGVCLEGRGYKVK